MAWYANPSSPTSSSPTSTFALASRGSICTYEARLVVIRMLLPEASELGSLRHTLLGIDIQLSPLITGSLPSSWSDLAQLQVLVVNSLTGISGTLPEAWSKIQELRQLYIVDLPGARGTLPNEWER